MKPSLRRAPIFVVLPFFTFATQAWAHPGHDDHELTWDFAHLAEHPLATMGCAAVVGAIACIVWQALRRRSPVGQSLRGSQLSRGK